MNHVVTDVINAMSVDVEDYFQVSAFEAYVKKSDWNSIPGRVEKNIELVLELFDKNDIKATFFTLGWIAERYPDLVKKIVSHGHELSSHGWDHTRVVNQDKHEFKQDVIRTRCMLEDISGEIVRGYRAASYSISSENLWAHDVLVEAGYEYSSSIVPIKHDLYGMPEAPRFAFFNDSKSLLEIPITTIQIAGRNINCGGGGWFRFFPYRFSRWALETVNQKERQSCVFYFHPWELDPKQPRIPGLSVKTQFRHYLNLNKTYERLERLINDFNWDRIDKVFLGEKSLPKDAKNI